MLKAYGGKGANQAVAAKRLLGGDYDVQMLGQVGDDQEGTAMVNFLAENGVDVSTIIKHEDKVSGQGFVLSLKEAADNVCIIVGGTNQVTMGDLEETWKKAIASADVLLLQREVP